MVIDQGRAARPRWVCSGRDDIASLSRDAAWIPTSGQKTYCEQPEAQVLRRLTAKSTSLQAHRWTLRMTCNSAAQPTASKFLTFLLPPQADLHTLTSLPDGV